MRCVSHTGYFAHGNNKGRTRGRTRYQNNSTRVVRNIEEKDVGTKGKSPKQDLTSAEDLALAPRGTNKRAQPIALFMAPEGYIS